MDLATSSIIDIITPHHELRRVIVDFRSTSSHRDSQHQCNEHLQLPESTNGVLQIPSSLRELALTANTGQVPEIILGGTSLIHSNVKSFALLGLSDRPTIDLLSISPPGLESLTVGGLLISDDQLPRSLTSLEWRLTKRSSCFDVTLKQLSALKSLKIIPKPSLSSNWKISKLDLPIGLHYLYAPLQLSQIIAILDDSPSCIIVSSLRLHFDALDVINAIQSNPDLLACTEPVFDGPQLIAALDSRFKNRVTFRPIEGLQEENISDFSWPSTKVILTSDAHLCMPPRTYHFPNATDFSISYSSSLTDLPPNLTTLDLHDTPLDYVEWDCFPRTLTHLASNSYQSLRNSSKYPGPVEMNFKHLDIPHWRLFWSETLAKSLHSDMEVFRIGEIIGIDDWHILALLSKFSPETLRNTSCSLLYIQTGELIAQYDEIKDYTIETMEILTPQLVDDALIPFLVAGASISTSPMPHSQLGPAVFKDYLVIPTHLEVETIHLLGIKKWSPVAPIGPETINGPSFALHTTSQPSFAFQSDKLKDLVLENSLLDRCEFPTSWPSSLVRIGLDALTVNDFRFITFPPSLEVLSLRSINSPVIGVLPFSLEILPTSLKRLTIQSVVAWHPQPTQPLAAGIHRFSLPSNFVSPYNLTLARFQGLLQDSLEYVFNALSLASATVEFKENDFHLGVKKLALNHKNVVISKNHWTHLD